MIGKITKLQSLNISKKNFVKNDHSLIDFYNYQNFDKQIITISQETMWPVYIYSKYTVYIYPMTPCCAVYIYPRTPCTVSFVLRHPSSVHMYIPGHPVHDIDLMDYPRLTIVGEYLGCMPRKGSRYIKYYATFRTLLSTQTKPKNNQA